MGGLSRLGATFSTKFADDEHGGTDNLPPTHMLLYLNDKTFLDPQQTTFEFCRQALDARVPIVLIHELDAKKGGCAFRHFFEATPKELVQKKLYDVVAVAWHSETQFREVSKKLVAKGMGAHPLRSCLSMSDMLAAITRGRFGISKDGEKASRVGVRLALRRDVSDPENLRCYSLKHSQSSKCLNSTSNEDLVPGRPPPLTHQWSARNTGCFSRSDLRSPDHSSRGDRLKHFLRGWTGRSRVDLRDLRGDDDDPPSSSAGSSQPPPRKSLRRGHGLRGLKASQPEEPGPSAYDFGEMYATPISVREEPQTREERKARLGAGGRFGKSMKRMMWRPGSPGASARDPGTSPGASSRGVDSNKTSRSGFPTWLGSQKYSVTSANSLKGGSSVNSSDKLPGDRLGSPGGRDEPVSFSGRSPAGGGVDRWRGLHAGESGASSPPPSGPCGDWPSPPGSRGASSGSGSGSGGSGKSRDSPPAVSPFALALGDEEPDVPVPVARGPSLWNFARDSGEAGGMSPVGMAMARRVTRTFSPNSAPPSSLPSHRFPASTPSPSPSPIDARHCGSAPTFYPPSPPLSAALSSSSHHALPVTGPGRAGPASQDVEVASVVRRVSRRIVPCRIVPLRPRRGHLAERTPLAGDAADAARGRAEQHHPLAPLAQTRRLR